MVGRLVSFWDGLFSGAMLVLGRANNKKSMPLCWGPASPSKQKGFNFQAVVDVDPKG